MSVLNFFTPNSIEELKQCLITADESTKFLSGGTDLIIKLRKRISKDVNIIDLSGIKELNYITEDNGNIKIGACTRFSQIASNHLTNKYAKCLSLAASEVGSVQIRNRATIGGNIANASPAADSMAPLLALGAKLLLMDKQGNKSVIGIENLISGVGKTNLNVGQVILEIFFPIRKYYFSNFIKLGSRKKVSISRLNIAISTGYNSKSGCFENVKVYVGAVGAVPLNAVKSASVLDKRKVDEEAMKAFSNLLAEEVEEAIKGRSSMPYKREAIKGLGKDLLYGLLSNISALEREELYDR